MAVNPTKIQAQGIDLATTVTADTNNSLTTDSSGLLKSLTTSTVSSGGTTPITNGGVYTALGGRAAIITDATPTSGSSNFMTSGSIYTALQNATGTKIYYGQITDYEHAEPSLTVTTRNGDFNYSDGSILVVEPTTTYTFTLSDSMWVYVDTDSDYKAVVSPFCHIDNKPFLMIYYNNKFYAFPQIYDYIVWNETPSGSMNGTNTTFTLRNQPFSILMVFFNGVKLKHGTDYTQSGSTIKMVTYVPESTDTLEVTYKRLI